MEDKLLEFKIRRGTSGLIFLAFVNKKEVARADSFIELAEKLNKENTDIYTYLSLSI
ncbi:hypothetical protein [Lachnospira multipara]|uniref:hypothetical protein n=1 Tax=Lachnospira multipara TaxID=28051 RepID=UPI000A96A677|nr:hypothetical protein [Lachnospira multipara]